MIAIVLAGGRGMRLWPESRQMRPKQLCKWVNGKSMLQNTLERLLQAGFQRLILVTGDDLKSAVEQVTDQLDTSTPIEILSEPEGKNTAPALGLALSACLQEPAETLLGIFPADHHIAHFSDFSHCLERASEAARKGFLTMLGVTPQRAETGYGYIEKAKYEFGDLPEVFPVQSFCEKPEALKAESYYRSGQYSWNAGIYICRRDILMQEYEKYLPDLYASMLGGPLVFRRNWSSYASISIDYGIAEKSDRMAVVSGDFGWCDLGSWNALGELYQADSAENVCDGKDFLLFQSQHCLLKQQEKTLVLYGVHDLLVVETEDVIFIADRDRAQDVRKIVASLKQQNRSDLL